MLLIMFAPLIVSVDLLMDGSWAKEERYRFTLEKIATWMLVKVLLCVNKCISYINSYPCQDSQPEHFM